MVPDEILQTFSGRAALVTGGTGLIGRQVVSRLLEAGARVRVASLDELVVDPRAEHLRGDLCEPGFAARAVRGMDCVFHLAGIKGSLAVTRSRPATFFVPLLLMNTHLLEAARREGVGRLVYTSSIGAYAGAEVFREDEGAFSGEPMDTYPGWAKRMAELQIEAYRIEHGLEGWAVVRPCNVYGPGDNFDPENAMVIPALMARIRSGERPLRIWGDGSAVRDFAYSADVADGVILALHHGTPEGFVNLGSGEGVSIRELVETLCEVVPFEYEFDASKPAGFPRRVMDISRARKSLGYEPWTHLRAGLEATWRWYVEHADENERRKNYFRDA